MLKLQVDTCIYLLETNLDGKIMEECNRFIESKREKRHFQIKQHQIGKFNRLQQQKLDQNKGGHSKQHVYQVQNCLTHIITEENILDTKSNNSNQSNQRERRDPDKNKYINKEKDHDCKWVHNLSSTPLTDAQKKILSRGPNFAILPKNPPVGKYIASIENAVLSCNLARQKN